MTRTKLRAVAVLAAILFLVAAAATAKDWQEKDGVYQVDMWGSAMTVEKDAMKIASSICVALDATFLELVGKEQLVREQIINGILNTTAGQAYRFTFHKEPTAARAPCDAMADEKRVKKYRKQLSKRKK